MDSDNDLKPYTMGSTKKKSYGYLTATNNMPWQWPFDNQQSSVEFEIQLLVESETKSNGILLYIPSNRYKFSNTDQEPWFVAAFLHHSKVHVM